MVLWNYYRDILVIYTELSLIIIPQARQGCLIIGTYLIIFVSIFYKDCRPTLGPEKTNCTSVQRVCSLLQQTPASYVKPSFVITELG